MTPKMRVEILSWPVVEFRISLLPFLWSENEHVSVNREHLTRTQSWPLFPLDWVIEAVMGDGFATTSPPPFYKLLSLFTSSTVLRESPQCDFSFSPSYLRKDLVSRKSACMEVMLRAKLQAPLKAPSRSSFKRNPEVGDDRRIGRRHRGVH